MDQAKYILLSMFFLALLKSFRRSFLKKDLKLAAITIEFFEMNDITNQLKPSRHDQRFHFASPINIYDICYYM